MAKNIKKLNRGDSYEFKVRVSDTDEKSRLTASDIVYFALLYPHQRFEEALLLRGYDYDDCIDKNGVYTGEILIKLEPHHTKCLAPGIYYYSIKLYRGGTLKDDGSYVNPKEVRTIRERTKFIVNE